MFLQDFFLFNSCFSQRFTSKFFLPVWVSLIGTDVLRDVVLNVKENVKKKMNFSSKRSLEVNVNIAVKKLPIQ